MPPSTNGWARFRIDLIYGTALLVSVGYLAAVEMDPRVLAFTTGLVAGYVLRVWEKMSVYRELVSEEAEQAVEAELGEQVGDRVEARLDEQVGEHVKACLDEQVDEHVEACLDEQVSEQIESELDEHLGDRLDREIEDRVAAEFDRLLAKNVEEALEYRDEEISE